MSNRPFKSSQASLLRKLKAMEFLKSAGFKAAQSFIEASETLKNKKVAGCFVGFGKTLSGSEALTVIDTDYRVRQIPLGHVVTIIENWVIAD